jgi:LPXTG-motif cell wall-anchored protein
MIIGSVGTVNCTSFNFKSGETYTWNGTAWSSYGTPPATGIADITGYTWAMIFFLLISAGLWGYILRRRSKKY